MASTYKLNDLLQEIKVAEQVTIDSIRMLHEDFLNDKRKFSQLVMTFSPSSASHTLGHIEQIEEALNS
jgi:hypothetical protein